MSPLQPSKFRKKVKVTKNYILDFSHLPVLMTLITIFHKLNENTLMKKDKMKKKTQNNKNSQCS